MKIAIAGGTGVVGRHVVGVARERGHETVVLSRATGVDLTAGSGLDAELSGVDAVIDVTSVATMSATGAMAFFRAVTRNLIEAERAAGVHHHVALSIIGAADAPHGYYAGKQIQEDLVLTAPSGSVVWAAQFHEFAQQNAPMTKAGPVHLVPEMLSQPVAAREVAGVLVEVAEGSPRGRGPQVAGPEQMHVADMIRGFLQSRGRPARVRQFPLPGAFGRALRDGTLLPGPGAHIGTRTFAEWLAAGESPDQ